MSGMLNLRSTMGGLVFVAVLAWSLMMVVVSQNEDVESCAPVTQELAPCLGFIKGSESGIGGGKPSPSCCSGVKKLADEAKTKQDKVALCECIKSSLAMIGPYDSSRIPLIPKQCGLSVQIPPIDNSTDCSKVVGFQFGSAFLYDVGDIHHH